MAAHRNKHFIFGNLGKDPEIKMTTTGTPVARFSVACTENWKDAQGSKKDHTEWFHVVVYGKLGELCGRFARKGKRIDVEGKMKTREYLDQAGVKKSITELIAENVIFIDFPEAADETAAAAAETQASRAFETEDVPF